MKKTLLICLALLLTQAIIAQDACAELMKFNDYQKNVNRTYRMTSKTPAVNQVQVVERDKNGNIHQTLSMDMPGQSMKIESVIIGTTMYLKNNNEDWTSQPLDSMQIESIKSQWQNNQLQFYKNCKKLDDETVDGKKYRVYSGEFDPVKMKEMMGKSLESMPNAEMMGNMEMKMIFYVNDKDDVEITKMNINVMGQSINSEMDFEYDMPITVTQPVIEKKG